MPPSTKTFIFHYAQSQPMNNIGSINGWPCWKVMKFGHNHMSRFRLNLGHLCVVASKIGRKTIIGTKMCSNIIITLMFHHFHIMWSSNKTQQLVEYLKWPMSQQKTMVLDTLFWLPPSNLWVFWT